MKNADLVLLLMDVMEITPEDEALIKILRKYTETKVIDMLTEGIYSRDTMLKEVYGLEFAKDYKQQVEKWVDETVNRAGKSSQVAKASPEKKE